MLKSMPNAHNYLYNGKELQDEQLGGVNLDWYDYGARFYDPALARFHTIDPKAHILTQQIIPFYLLMKMEKDLESPHISLLELARLSGLQCNS